MKKAGGNGSLREEVGSTVEEEEQATGNELTSEGVGKRT